MSFIQHRKAIKLYELQNQLKAGIYSFSNIDFTRECTNDHGSLDFRSIFIELGIKEKYLSFFNCTFNTNVTFYNRELPEGEKYAFEFDNNSFTKVIFFHNVSFNGCRFFVPKSDKYIPGMTNRFFEKVGFRGDLEIQSCMFENTVEIYNDTEFIGKVWLNDIIFKESLEINNVEFNKSVYFYSTEFLDNFYLRNVQFNDGLYFGRLQRGPAYPSFKGISEFDCLIKKFLVFKDAEFNVVNFSNLKFFDCKVEFIQTEFQGISLFRNLDLNNFIFINCNLTNCSYLYSVVQNVIFSSCSFDFKKLIDDEFIKNNIYEKLREVISWYRPYGDIAINDFSESDLLRQLKQFEIYFDKHKDYELSGEFYKKSLEIQGRDKSKWFKWIVLKAYNLFSEYGENYKRAFIIFCLTIVIFAIIYLFTGVIYIDRDKNIPEFVIYYFKGSNIYNFFYDFAISFLYSISNSFPIRKELDIVKSANGLTTLISYIQTAIQTIIATLFVFALRRKFKRD